MMSQLLFLALLSAAYITWGTLQTMSIKWADVLSSTDRFDNYIYSFAHPFVQAFIMFISETLCLLVFIVMLAVKKWIRRQPIVKGKDIALPCNPTVWMLPAGADFLASILQNVGLTLTYASVYQMLRGSVVIFIAALSFFWLGRRFTRQEYVGMIIVAIGLTFVGLSSIISNNNNNNSGNENNANRNPLLGNLLIISAQILHAYQGVCEERLSKLYHIPPLQMVGVEGVYGAGFSPILLAGLQLTPSTPFLHNVVNPIKESTINATLKIQVPFDDIILAFDQMRFCKMCLISMILYVFGGFFYNACQQTIIKYFSAAACVMIGSLRNITVWIVALSIPGIFEERFSFLQLIGFCFLVAGNILFQRIIPDRWWYRYFPYMLETRSEGNPNNEIATDLTIENTRETPQKGTKN